MEPNQESYVYLENRLLKVLGQLNIQQQQLEILQKSKFIILAFLSNFRLQAFDDLQSY